MNVVENACLVNLITKSIFFPKEHKIYNFDPDLINKYKGIDDFDPEELKKLKKDKQDLMARIQELESHNQKLSEEYKKADTAAMEHYERSVKLQLEEAKRMQTLAIDEGDAQKQAEAMELIAKSAADARAIENYKKQMPAKVEKEEKQQQQNQNPQTYNPDIVDWVRQNAWFNENSGQPPHP